MAFDWSTGMLDYDLAVAGVPSPELRGVYLHRGTVDSPGPVIHQLVESARIGHSGKVPLGAVDRAALAGGELYLQVLTHSGPDGAFRVPLEGGGP